MYVHTFLVEVFFVFAFIRKFVVMMGELEPDELDDVRRGRFVVREFGVRTVEAVEQP